MLQKLRLAYYDTIAPDIEVLLAEFDALDAERDALREALEEIEQEEGYGESPAPVIVARVRKIARAALERPV